jgi:hypothetical protein
MYYCVKNTKNNSISVSTKPLEIIVLSKNLYGLYDTFDFSIRIKENTNYIFFISNNNYDIIPYLEFKLCYNDIVDTLYKRYDDGYLNAIITKSFITEYPKKDIIIYVLHYYLPLELIYIIIDFLKLKIIYGFECTYKNNIYLSKPKIYIPNIFKCQQ